MQSQRTSKTLTGAAAVALLVGAATYTMSSSTDVAETTNLFESYNDFDLAELDFDPFEAEGMEDESELQPGEW